MRFFQLMPGSCNAAIFDIPGEGYSMLAVSFRNYFRKVFDLHNALWNAMASLAACGWKLRGGDCWAPCHQHGCLDQQVSMGQDCPHSNAVSSFKFPCNLLAMSRCTGKKNPKLLLACAEGPNQHFEALRYQRTLVTTYFVVNLRGLRIMKLYWNSFHFIGIKRIPTYQDLKV